MCQAISGKKQPKKLEIKKTKHNVSQKKILIKKYLKKAITYFFGSICGHIIWQKEMQKITHSGKVLRVRYMTEDGKWTQLKI